jgi:hypothetical protein
MASPRRLHRDTFSKHRTTGYKDCHRAVGKEYYEGLAGTEEEVRNMIISNSLWDPKTESCRYM